MADINHHVIQSMFKNITRKNITRNRLNSGEAICVGRVVACREDGQFTRSLVKDVQIYYEESRSPTMPTRVVVSFGHPIAYEWSSFAKIVMTCLTSGKPLCIDMGGRLHGSDSAVNIPADEIVGVAMTIQKLLGERGLPPRGWLPRSGHPRYEHYNKLARPRHPRKAMEHAIPYAPGGVHAVDER